MGENSAIAWTDHTFNPWWGCTKVSAGCANCYAQAFAERFGHECFGGNPRRRFGQKHWQEPLKWNRAAEKAGKRARVFCGSMCDVFEAGIDVAYERDRLWSLIVATPMLDWLLLTKRPENIGRLAPWGGLSAPENVWMGTTVEDRDAKERIIDLRYIDAKVRFLSCEPLIEDLGHVDLTGISWVIVGSESGPRARLMDHAWARSLRDQCQAAGVPYFLKQAIVNGKLDGEPTLDGRTWREFPR